MSLRDAPDLPLVRVQRCVMVRVDAETGESELRHVGAPDGDEASCTQARHRGSIVLGCRRIFQHDRAGRGHAAGDVEQILDRDRNAGEWRRRRTARAQTVAVISCCQRFLRMNLQKDTLPFSRLIRDPRQALLHEAAAFHGTAEISCELEERGHCL